MDLMVAGVVNVEQRLGVVDSADKDVGVDLPPGILILGSAQIVTQSLVMVGLTRYSVAAHVTTLHTTVAIQK